MNTNTREITGVNMEKFSREKFFQFVYYCYFSREK